MNAGQRVVLVAPRSDLTALAGAVLMIERLGWSLVAIVDPEHQREALAMVVDDLADAVVPLRAEYVTVLRYLADLEGGDERTRPVARPKIVAGGGRTTDRTQLLPRSGSHRRPRLIA